MKKIKIEEVGDINYDFPYLEVFLEESKIPFLEVGILENKTLSFKLYASQTDVALDVEEWEYILSIAKDFLPRAIKNENDFLDFDKDHQI